MEKETLRKYSLKEIWDIILLVNTSKDNNYHKIQRRTIHLVKEQRGRSYNHHKHIISNNSAWKKKKTAVDQTVRRKRFVIADGHYNSALRS